MSPLLTPKPNPSKSGSFRIKKENSDDDDDDDSNEDDELNETIKPGMDFSSPNLSKSSISANTPCKAKRSLLNPNGLRTPTPFKNALAELGKRRGEM